jgi:hypothetical protein
MIDFRNPFQIILSLKRKKKTEKLPETLALPDVISKMLTDKGCTVNRDGAEEVAAFFVSTCLELISQSQADLRKLQQDIESERKRW